MSSSKPAQIPLVLPVDAASERDNLAEGPANQTAVSIVDAWPDWPGQTLLIAGPTGSGKSHLASIWADRAEARMFTATDLGDNLETIVEVAGVGGNLVIEDIVQEGLAETALFHVLNAVREGGAYCLMTSRGWPAQWEIGLEDLKSRLRAMQTVELGEPDDDLLKKVMVKLFADRQLNVDMKVVNYCVLRMERSLESANRLVELIDTEALARRAPVTRRMASDALDQMESGQTKPGAQSD